MSIKNFPIIKALIFDMDGLIFDSERVVQRSWNQAGQILGYGQIGEHIYHTLGFNVVRRTQYMKETFGQDFPMDDFNAITRRTFHEIAETEGIPMKPGVKELLTLAKENEWKLAVATSSRKEHSTTLLKSAGIWDYFDGAIFGDMVTVAKPDPEIYQKAAEMIGVEPKCCIALEDSPAGIQSSYAAGMYPIMIPDLVQPTKEISSMCWQCVQSLNDVVKILRIGDSGELLREASAYKVKVRHTLEEYYALPNDQRVELIDGEFFEMAAPRIVHQALLYKLSYQVMDFIKKQGGKCQPFFAPTDVQLDENDNTTIVQPDLMIVCDENKITDKNIIGAPDFIIEILSPSTREKDTVIKTNKYRETGVREYWMVDIDQKRVIAYYFDEDCIPAISGFDQPIPVRIYDGDLEIVFE